LKEGKYIHVAIGNLNIDIAVYLERLPTAGEALEASHIDVRPGGAATNYAVAVAQYGHVAYLLASVSNNRYIKAILEDLAKLGVNVSRVKVVDEPPGVVVVLVQPGGERSMVKYPGANRELTPSDVPRELLLDAHVVHIASITPKFVCEIAKMCARENIFTTYDPGLYVAALAEDLASVVGNLDVLFVNEREFKLLSKKASASALFKYGLSMLVVKMGQRGAIALLPSGVCYYGSAQPIKKPVDTTGAGDSFNAFFNAKYVESKDPALALTYGIAAGALKAGSRGSFLRLDHKLFDAQLKKVVVEKAIECPFEIC